LRFAFDDDQMELLGRLLIDRAVPAFAAWSIGMNTAPSSSQSARDSLKEAREGVREAGGAAAASGDIQKDLQALRDDFARLAEQVTAILSDKGNTAWQHAKASVKTGVDGAVSDAQAKGQEAIGAMREVSDNFVEAIDQSIKERPYATLAIAAALGFLFGATWRR
jgi:ElaB/YqjD/DUF883 family membrane-anchored ribosome-binding protein